MHPIRISIEEMLEPKVIEQIGADHADVNVCVVRICGYVRSLERDLETALSERDRLGALLNSPEILDFIKGVPLEAAHQLERWGVEHDREKTGEGWIFLFGLLAGKAIGAAKIGNGEKARHHAVTAAAAMANFHRLISRGGTTL